MESASRADLIVVKDLFTQVLAIFRICQEVSLLFAFKFHWCANKFSIDAKRADALLCADFPLPFAQNHGINYSR